MKAVQHHGSKPQSVAIPSRASSASIQQPVSYGCRYNSSLELEWDANKAALNLRNHGVDFEDAAVVFYDHGRIETFDGRKDYNEDRWATIGLAAGAVLYVVYTVRSNETIRIISARKALPHERKQYREANR